MDGVKTLKQQRQELYTEKEFLVKHFLFCYDLIKRDPKKERVVLKRGDKEITRNYNIEIIVALLLMKWFSIYSPLYKKSISNGDLMTIWGIAFDEECPYHIKGSKKRGEIIPSDYINCYHPRRRTTFDMNYHKNTTFHTLAAYVSHKMLFDYMGIFLEGLQYHNVGGGIYDEIKLPDYDYDKFFHNAFEEFVNGVRGLAPHNILNLEKIHHIEGIKPRKETGYTTSKKRKEEEEIKKALEDYEDIKGTPRDDGDPLGTLDFFEVNSDYGVWKTVCDYRLDRVIKYFFQKIKWTSLELNYEIQQLN